MPWPKGRKPSLEHRRKISEANKIALKGHFVSAETGRKISEANKGRITWMKGRKHTEESKRKMSESKKGQRRPHTKKSRKKISDALRGHPVSKKTRRKIGDANRGKVRSEKFKRRLSEVFKGRTPWIAGRHHTDEAKEKISRAIRGRNHYNWKDGSSFEPYPLEFNSFLRRQIRRRDGQTCQYCGGLGRCVHHIDYDKENNDPSNLVTLCASCHGRTTNNNREIWTALFNSLIIIE